jgi:RNA polymerase sigma factor (sigma-70 family)
MAFQQQSATDTELVHSFLGGNEDALQQLIYRYKDKIYTTIHMLVKDKYLAEDLFQEAFLKMISTMRQGRYSEQGKFLPWASRIAHNLCMDHYRRLRNKLPVTLANGEDIMELLAGADESSTPRMEHRQTEATLCELLEQLVQEQREVIVLRIYGDMSFKEISELTDVSINTALGRMRYGLINLRRLIADQELVLR